MTPFINRNCKVYLYIGQGKLPFEVSENFKMHFNFLQVTCTLKIKKDIFNKKAHPFSFYWKSHWYIHTLHKDLCHHLHSHNTRPREALCQVQGDSWWKTLKLSRLGSKLNNNNNLTSINVIHTPA